MNLITSLEYILVCHRNQCILKSLNNSDEQTKERTNKVGILNFKWGKNYVNIFFLFHKKNQKQK